MGSSDSKPTEAQAILSKKDVNVLDRKDIRKLWDLYDTDKSGSLDKAEGLKFTTDLVNAMVERKVFKLDAAGVKKMATDMFDSRDTDGDGKLIWSEFFSSPNKAGRKILEDMKGPSHKPGEPLFDRKTVQALWDSYDDDKSGTLEKAEAVAFFADFVKGMIERKEMPELDGETVTEAAQRFFFAYDTNGDGTIEWGEFFYRPNKKGMKTMKAMKLGADGFDLKTAKTLWATYDKDDSGSLCATEARSFFQDFAKALVEKGSMKLQEGDTISRTAAALYSAFDTDSDGSVSWREFYPYEKRVLIVCTSATEFKGGKTGVWSEEMTGPYYAFQKAGIDVDIASVTGSIVIDANSVGKDFKTENDEKFEKDAEFQKKFKAGLKFADAKLNEYNAVFFAGGHGTVIDFEGLGDLVSKWYKMGKVVAAVCHGPHSLLKAKNFDGKPLVDGKTVTGFTDAEEKMVGQDANVPFLLEAKLRELGCKFEAADAPFGVKAVQTARLITGQNPASSVAAAELVIKQLLKKRTTQAPAAAPAADDDSKK